jgi:hypothetical protein
MRRLQTATSAVVALLALRDGHLAPTGAVRCPVAVALGLAYPRQLMRDRWSDMV